MESKERLFELVEAQHDELVKMCDDIYDHPELGHTEFHAMKLVGAYLEKNGFSVEYGVGGLATALRGEYICGKGGVSIGFCGEYDCLPKGHACGHHMQTGFACGAAVAMKEVMKDEDVKIVVYTTPDEECNVRSGKREMVEGGCFKDLDLALICHAGDITTIDEWSMAGARLYATYTGVAAHASAYPWLGRPAWDAAQLAISGLAYLRAWLPAEAGINADVLEFESKDGGDYQKRTKLSVAIRSRKSSQIEDMVERVNAVLKGAAVMTETEVEIVPKDKPTLSKFRIGELSDLFYKNAEEAKADRIRPPRNRAIGTDTGTLSHFVPTFGGRVAFAPEGSNAHSDEWLALGKSESAHKAITDGGKILAGMAYDYFCDPEMQKRIRKEWEEKKDLS